MSADAATVLALDVGGTAIKAAFVDGAGHLTHTSSRPTPVADGPRAVVDAVCSLARELAAKARAGSRAGLAACGVVAPGRIDPVAGVARYAANLGWHDVPLGRLVRDATGLPTTLGHDVRAAGLAETALGAARGVEDSLVVVLGTGVAAVVTSDGRPLDGATRLAGEVGHLPVWPDGEACPCGQRGCLERYASAAAIERHYRQRTGRAASAAQVAAALGTDPAADAVWDEAATALAIALASCTMVLDPELIVLGGGLSAAGDTLLGPVRARLRERVVWRECPRLALSALGARAGLLGAALLARETTGPVG